MDTTQRAWGYAQPRLSKACRSSSDDPSCKEKIGRSSGRFFKIIADKSKQNPFDGVELCIYAIGCHDDYQTVSKVTARSEE